MTVYTIELDGEEFDIEGPDNATDAQLEQVAREQRNTPLESNPRGPQADFSGVSQGPDVSQMDSKGLEQPALDPIQLGVAVGPAVGKAALGAAKGLSRSIGNSGAGIGAGTDRVIDVAKTVFAPSLEKTKKAIQAVEKGVVRPQITTRPSPKTVESIVKGLPDDILENPAGYVKQIESYSPQQLRNLKDLLSESFNSRIPTEAGRAKLATAKDLVSSLYNKRIPGREALAQDFSRGLAKEELVKSGKRLVESTPIVGPVIRGTRRVAEALGKIPRSK